ncbi:MAG: bifunctional precorrin-2 dehydrogenase/sirohydrochlorin ferrochelatase [Desulfobacteraceae bacterium]|jgi:precorrin-2 dehydrogenase/sirohydrochlorin ferrochelatase
MPFYPILVNLQGQKAVVVGGGKVAQRKIETLLEFGALVHVIAKELTPTLRQYVKTGEIEHRGAEFMDSDLNGAFLVIAATDNPELNQRVSQLARGKGLLVNAVDQPADCNFIVPSILRRGDLLISVSTSGKSPALARKIRQRLEKGFGKEYEALLILMGRLRPEILSEGLSQDENRRIFQKLVDSRLLKAIREKDWDRMAAILCDVLQRPISPEDVMHYLKVE